MEEYHHSLRLGYSSKPPSFHHVVSSAVMAPSLFSSNDDMNRRPSILQHCSLSSSSPLPRPANLGEEDPAFNPFEMRPTLLSMAMEGAGGQGIDKMEELTKAQIFKSHIYPTSSKSNVLVIPNNSTNNPTNCRRTSDTIQPNNFDNPLMDYEKKFITRRICSSHNSQGHILESLPQLSNNSNSIYRKNDTTGRRYLQVKDRHINQKNKYYGVKDTTEPNSSSSSSSSLGELGGIEGTTNYRGSNVISSLYFLRCIKMDDNIVKHVIIPLFFLVTAITFPIQHFLSPYYTTSTGDLTLSSLRLHPSPSYPASPSTPSLLSSTAPSPMYTTNTYRNQDSFEFSKQEPRGALCPCPGPRIPRRDCAPPEQLAELDRQIVKKKAELEDDTQFIRIYEMFFNDGPGRKDWALQSEGGKILKNKTTTKASAGNWISSLVNAGILSGYINPFDVWPSRISKDASTVLQPSIQVGECFEYRGKVGTITIKLTRMIRISSVSIDHSPLSVANNFKHAPKHFSVFIKPQGTVSDTAAKVLVGERRSNSGKVPQRSNGKNETEATEKVSDEGIWVDGDMLLVGRYVFKVPLQNMWVARTKTGMVIDDDNEEALFSNSSSSKNGSKNNDKNRKKEERKELSSSIMPSDGPSESEDNDAVHRRGSTTTIRSNNSQASIDYNKTFHNGSVGGVTKTGPSLSIRDTSKEMNTEKYNSYKVNTTTSLPNDTNVANATKNIESTYMAEFESLFERSRIHSP